jgi:hypothetical protein
MSNLKAIHEASRLQPINKLMVVGHPLSGLASVEQLLHDSGLKPAAKSKAQGLSPAQVSEMVLRAYRVPPVDALQVLEVVNPIMPSPVWQTLALDLMLGNIEHDLWGWSDPQAVYLLDYWKNLDNQVAFVLVYDSPQDTLTRLFNQPDVECNADIIASVVTTWLAFNEALLNFYLGNTERCLLVNSQQVSAKSTDYLLQVRHQMGVDLQLLSDEVPSPSAPSAWQVLQLQLIDSVLAGQTKALHLYADLQSVASLPFKAIPDSASEQTALAVLQTFVQMHRTNLRIQQKEIELLAKLQDLNIQLDKAKQESQDAKEAVSQALNTSKTNQLAQEQAYQAQLRQQAQVLQHKEAELLAKLQDLNNQLDKAKQDTKDAATKASLAQEAVAKAEAKAAASEEAAKAAIANIPPPAPAPVTFVAAADTKALEEENQLLLEQLHLVQEELERYYLENQDLKKKQPKPADKVYGAAQRVQQQLNYRLGATMIAHSRSLKGWLHMPTALLGEVRVYRKEQSTEAAQMLPPLETYADAHEAERYRKHLSYQLGQTMLKHAKTPWGWLLMPLALAGTANSFGKARLKTGKS